MEFDYNLVRHGVKRRYTVNPCFLKENQQRWYVGALDRRELKLFSLDRISNLEIMSDSTFERPEIDVEAQWKDCYGIWDNLENPVEEIVLRYSALDGNFIKGVPLHHSQKVLSDTDEEFVISVRLRISNDFIMVLLSRSKSVEVIEPLHLRQTIRDISAACAERNK